MGRGFESLLRYQILFMPDVALSRPAANPPAP
ncbi:MAG: hypothetical protein K0S35_2084 [Geminicoccaceae bacterium]|nr:hypothetical protein [Geminicoccaceae bacterium]